MSNRKQNLISTLVVALAFLSVQSVFACAACAGKSDSDLARGMNWGIFTLLGVVLLVLGGFAAFFVHLVKRSAANPVAITSDALAQTTPQI